MTATIAIYYIYVAGYVYFIATYIIILPNNSNSLNTVGMK